MPVKTYLEKKPQNKTSKKRKACDTAGKSCGNTHSTVLLHAGGLLIVMKTQFARIVIMMSLLNNLRHD